MPIPWKTIGNKKLLSLERIAEREESLQVDIEKRTNLRNQLKVKVDIERFRITLAKLRVSEAELNRAPRISELFSEASDGLDGVIEAMRFSENDILQAFLKKYDNSTNDDKQYVPWEAFVLSAGLNPQEFIGAVILCLRDQSVNRVKILSITAHPEVMQARIRAAKLPGGRKDRDAMDTALGFLPSPKGPTFINRQYVNASDQKQVEESAGSGDTDLDYLFPPISETQKRLPERSSHSED